MSNKQETNSVKSNTSTDQVKKSFEPGLTLPDDLKDIEIDYNIFGTFNSLPALTSKNDQS